MGTLSLFDGYIKLIQEGPDSFMVVYGQDVRSGLTYDAAASNLGHSLMHYAAGESIISAPADDERLLTFDEALEELNNECAVLATAVEAEALSRKVWVSMNGLPGCMPNSRAFHATESDAIDKCVLIAGDEAPESFISELERYDNAWLDGELYTVYSTTLAELL